MNAAIGLVCGPHVAATSAAKFVTAATAAGVAVNFIEVGNENYGGPRAAHKQASDNVGSQPMSRQQIV